MEIFAVCLARKRTCTGFADKHCKPTREGFAVHSHATKFPLSGKHNFPYTEIFLLLCRVYRKHLSLPFGIDDSIAADYLCQQKKQWKMESTKQIRSIRPICGQKSNPPSLPFREGLGVGFLPFREGQGVGFSPREARLTHKKGVSSVSGVSGVSGVSFRFWTKKTPIFGPNRNKTGVSSVPSVSAVPSVSSRKKQTPNQARSATNQASLQAANQVRSAANPQKRCLRCFKFKICITLLILPI
ncbi:MAG: hypothetical protein ACI307_09910 [Sodaliphilus sp.]